MIFPMGCRPTSRGKRRRGEKKKKKMRRRRRRKTLESLTILFLCE